jgi:hypothetical protein
VWSINAAIGSMQVNFPLAETRDAPGDDPLFRAQVCTQRCTHPGQ